MNIKKQYIPYCFALIAFLLTFTGYVESLFNDFVYWDDSAYVVNNKHIQSLNWALFRFAFLDFYSYNWHPITWISHALDYAIWGLNPFGHHLTNNLIHAINTFLVVILVTRLIEAAREAAIDNSTVVFLDDQTIYVTSLIAGIIFGLHPLHVESVAWIAERKDLLCALFFLISVLYYLKHLRELKNAGHFNNNLWIFFNKQYFFTLGFFVLALLSKPMAVSLPVVLIILDWYPFGRIKKLGSIWKCIVEKIPFFILSIAASIITILAQKSGEAIWEAISAHVRILVAIKSLCIYLWKFLWPMDLLPFYPHPRTAQLFSLEYLSYIIILFGITTVVILKSKKQKLWLAACIYYVITLFPVLGLVQAGGQSMADRYMYLPSMGPVLMISIVFSWIWKTLKGSNNQRLTLQFFGYGSILFILLTMSYLTINQIRIWNNPLGLWNYVINKEPEKALFAYYNRAHAYARIKQYQNAIADYTRVINNNYQEYSKVYIDRGLTYLKVGEIEPALSDLKRACELGDVFGCKAMMYFKKPR